LAKNDPDLGILVQGYTDQQGSANYNKRLGLMRGEKVKEFLVSQGVGDHAIKVVSLGEEGVLCIDTSDICRNMNRRVHLEIRKIGQEHMVVPALATTPSQTSIDSSVKTEDFGFRTEDIPPPSEPTGVATEPPSGS
jgi:peptidoglycan-associated lipoprotein